MFYREDSDHIEAEEVIKSREFHLRLLQAGLLLVFILSFYHLATGQLPWGHNVMKRITEVAPQLENPKAMVMLPGWFRSNIDHPEVLRTKEHVIIGLWWGAAISAALSFILLLTAAWWLPRGQKEGREDLATEETEDENAGESGFAKLVSSGPIFYLFMVGALAIGAWLRVPAVQHSLWNDEEYAMRRFAHGGYERGKDGKSAFVPATWQETLFENGNGNNHLLNSLTSRVSLDLWRSFTKAKPEEFSEVALRLPALLAGVLTIGLIAVIGWELGLPWAGVGAAWLLALHPWHVRYSAEAKGYSLMMFFVCLALLGLIRALKHHRQSAWQMFAIGEAGFLLSFAGSIYIAIAVNAIALVELIVRKQPKRLIALIAFNLLAALPVVVWTLPSVPQLLGFMDHDNSARLPANAEWLRDLGSHITTGSLYSNPESNEHLGTSWVQMAAAHPTLMQSLAASMALLVILGLIAALFENTAARVVIWGITLAGALAFWHAGTQHHPNLAWYYIYLLIPATLAVALACVRLQLLPALVVIMVVGWFGMATETPRAIFVKHDRQPIKQTVTAIREKKPEALTGTFGVSDRQAQSYDPHVKLLSTPEEVDQLLDQGQQEGRNVFIYYCGVTETLHRKPDLVKRVSVSPDFEAFKQVKGLEALFSYHIFKWKGLRLGQ